MLLRQYFNESLQDEWLPTQSIFYDEPFSFSARSKTIDVWVNNDSSNTFDNVIVSVSARSTPYITADELTKWVEFASPTADPDDDEFENSHTPEFHLGRMAANETKRYRIRVTIPASILDDANFSNIVPTSVIKFHIRAVTANTTTTFTYIGRNGFDHPDAHLYRTELDDDEWIVLSRSPLSGSWSRIIDLSALVPCRITDLTIVGETPNNTQIVPFMRRAETEVNINAEERITIPQPTTLSREDQNLPYAQVVVALRDSTALQGDTPRVREVRFTVISDTSNTYTYPSQIRFEKTTELPDGTIALNHNGEVLAILNNDVVSFSFGYARHGGNAEFQLMLRWNWDHDLPFDYDDAIVYVQDNKVQYRGIIDKIHTKLLDNKESVTVSGYGLAKQMTTILVNQTFRNIGVTDAVRHLIDKYLSDSRSPYIFYNNLQDLEQISTTIATDAEPLDFNNVTLYDAIAKIANIAGANPTNEGSDGNDIIWGVDERCHFYFKRKSTDLNYRFHVSKDISLDDSRVAPRFNRIRLVGYSKDGDMNNVILDGNCEGTRGSTDEAFNVYWLVSDNIRVKAVTGINDVYHGSQAYQFSVVHTDATSHSTTFRTFPFDLPRHTDFMLRFFAKASSSNTVKLRVGIRTSFEELNRPLPTDLFDQTDITATYLLNAVFNQYRVGPYTVPGVTLSNSFGGEAEMEYMPTTVFFAVEPADPAGSYEDEEVTIDGVFMYQGSTALVQPRFIREDGHVYEREVFSSDQRFEVVVSDWTEINRFGRIKESIREVDTISGFKNAYDYARSILGGNATETHRAVLTVRNTQELYRPTDFNLSRSVDEQNQIQWGYAQVFGSVNPDTHYEYSMVSVKHTLINNRFDTKIELGAKRPTIDEMIRQLTARERFSGQGADTARR